MNTVQLDGKLLPIRWDRVALFRADEIGLPELLASGKLGFSTLCKRVWVMLDDDGRKRFPSPEKVAAAMPMSYAANAWEVVLRAYNESEGVADSPAKNAGGGIAPSPESSSG